MGIGQRRTEARVPTNLIDLALGNFTDTVSELKTNFVTFGFGNQWQFAKRYTVVVDWFTLNIPYSGEVVHSVSDFTDDENNKEKIRDAEDFLKYYPSGAVLKAEIGIMF